MVVTEKFWPTVEAPKTVASALVKLTALVPLLENETAPVSKLLWPRVIAFVPAVNEEVPGTVKTPV